MIFLFLSSQIKKSFTSLAVSAEGYQLQTSLAFNNRIVSNLEMQTNLYDFQSKANTLIPVVLPSGYYYSVNVTQMDVNSKFIIYF